MKFIAALNIMGLRLAVGGQVESAALMTQNIETASNLAGPKFEDFALGNTNFGITEQLATSDTEKCAVYQKAYKVSNIIAKKDGYKNRPLPGGIKAQGVVQYEGVSELCGYACGILDVCPDECPSNDDIEQFCDFHIPSPYTASDWEENETTTFQSEAISFSSECGFCVDTCRSDCLAFVYGCCPCAPAKAIVIATAKDHAGEGRIDVTDEHVLDLVDTDFWTGPLFLYSFVSQDTGDGTGAVFDQDGIGLYFDDNMLDNVKIKSSLLCLWKQPLNGFNEEQTSFLPPYNVDPLRWKYNEDLSESEDVVYVKGDEYDTGGDVSGRNAQFRIVFRDSAGWHISDPYKLSTYQAIRMADPSCKYYRFNPNVLDYDKAEAGRTYGPSKPSFNCIQAVGIQVNAAATDLDDTGDESFYRTEWTNFAFEAKTWSGYN